MRTTEHIVAAKTLLQREGSLLALINDAGHNYIAPLEATDWDKARVLMETNLFGLAALTQAMIPLSRASASKDAHRISSMSAQSAA